MTAIANAMAESFVDTFKTELIKDRVWQSRSQLELAILEYVDWFNNRRLHESLADIPPVEFETNWASRTAIAADPKVTATSQSASERLTAPRPDHGQTETGAPGPSQADGDPDRPARNGSREEPDPARTAPNQSVDDRPQLVSLTR